MSKIKKMGDIVKGNNVRSVDITRDDGIPVIQIIDPYAYVSGTKVIAIISIKGPKGERKGTFMRTKKGGYVFC